MWLRSPDISCIHGFSTRYGGVSPKPFNTLNLGGSEDDPSNIEINRLIALEKLGVQNFDLCNLKQVHGNTANIAKPGQQEGDALVTNQKGLVLAVSIADCYPILFHDPMNGIIGAAHAGWRGTVSGIAETALNAMIAIGAKKESITVAIGQGISRANFEVGNEVIGQFEKNGFPSSCWKNNHIDLAQCNRYVLMQNHISENNIWTMNRCTFEDDFFSYRRDKGITGRMWAAIAMDKD